VAEALSIQKNGWILKSNEGKGGCFDNGWRKRYLSLVGTTLTFSVKEDAHNGTTIEITPNVKIDADSTLEFARL
jgi:hypothetical protein